MPLLLAVRCHGSQRLLGYCTYQTVSTRFWWSDDAEEHQRQTLSHFHCRQSTSDTAMPAVKLYECFCWGYSTPTAFIRETWSLFFLFFPPSPPLAQFCSRSRSKTILSHAVSFSYLKFARFLFTLANKCGEKNFLLLHISKPSVCPTSVIYSFLTFSPPSPRIPQPHHNTVNRRALTDLLPSSFHWPPA